MLQRSNIAVALPIPPQKLAHNLPCLAVQGVLAALVFGIGPSDPLTIVAATGVLLMVTVAAAFFPARRAMRTDPMVVLREE